MKLACLTTAISLAVASPAFADPTVGFDRFEVNAAHRAGPVAAALWSPVGRPTYAAPVGGNAVFKGVDAYIGAALPNTKMPLIVVSHGSGSSIDGTAWLAAGLAGQGALVLVLNHPGTTSRDSSPRRTVRLSERAADLSAALDHVLDDPYFAARIDVDHISALGFSLGGATVLGLGGLRFDPKAYAGFCEAAGDSAQDCLFLARGGVDFDNLPPQFSADMKDDRFSRIVAVDPGFTYAATAQSAADLDRPVQLVSLGDTFPWFTVDVRTEGSGLVDLLPNVNHTIVPNAHHYSFLPLCTKIAPQLLIEEGEDPICDDPEGWDRASAHDASIAAIAAFLEL